MAEVTVDGQVAPEFEVRNGLRQGCVLAPTLFNLYFNMVIGQWRERCMDFGVSVLYKCGGRLVGERTRRPFITRVSELQFADDLAAVGTSEVECVTEFKYLGSIVQAKGGITQEVGERIAKVNKAFGALWEPVFRDSNLSLRTKRKVYKAVVLEVLLYGSETWTTKRNDVRRLEVFHNRFLKESLESLQHNELSTSAVCRQ